MIYACPTMGGGPGFFWSFIATWRCYLRTINITAQKEQSTIFTSATSQFHRDEQAHKPGRSACSKLWHARRLKRVDTWDASVPKKVNMAADPKALFVLVGILVLPFISVLSVYPHQMHSAAQCSSLAVTTVQWSAIWNVYHSASAATGM